MAPIASVIKYEGDNSTFIWKHPCEDFNTASQLIVHESQEAILFLNGQALDLFGPGRHTLETENIPILRHLINIPTGGVSAFHCEVYFINKTEQMAIRWGTDSKVQYVEPTYKFPLSIGASGEMSLCVDDSRKLLVNPLLEVIASLALGSLLGLAYTYVERFFHSRSKRLCVAITFVILAVSLSMMEFTIPGTEIEVGFSSLLVCMMLGTIFCNICPSSEELMAKTDRWTAPLFVLFFVISGAELDLSVFSDVTCVLIGLVYILFRSLGKITGAGISSKFMKCEPVVQKWLGLTLLPQAGVALGMSITVAELGAEGAIIRSIVLFSVLIYELVGPMLTKIALTKAGEIHPKEETPAPAAK